MSTSYGSAPLCGSLLGQKQLKVRDNDEHAQVIYSSSEMDIRLFTNNKEPKENFSAEIAMAVTQLASVPSKLRELGFPLNARVQALVGIGSAKLIYLADDQTPSAKIRLLHPESYSIHNRQRSFSVHYEGVRGLHKKIPIARSDDALFIPMGKITNKFIIAHEFVHLTQPIGSHKSGIWKEARADFIAFLISGESGFTEDFEIDQIGSPSVPIRLSRSMVSPKIKTKPDIVLSSDSYHDNSELVSSLLYEIGQKIDLEIVWRFVRWMDTVRKPGSLLQETNAAGLSEGRERILVRLEVNQIIDLLTEWSEDSDFVNDEQAKLIADIIKARGF